MKTVSLRERYACIDCSAEGKLDWDLYMVEAELWKSLGLKYSDNLCFIHLERRLGRPLVLADFTHADINRGIRIGFRMSSRPTVLCLNDFPIGVYRSKELAEEAAKKHRKKHPPTSPFVDNYHTHDFVMGSEAGL